jgi:rhamnosyltransferase
MEHGLGTETFHFWLGRLRSAPLHSPERHYYVFRNSLMLLRMPHASGRWIRNDIVRLIFMAIVFPVFAPDRWHRIRLMARGIRDGLRGVTGPLR